MAALRSRVAGAPGRLQVIAAPRRHGTPAAAATDAPPFTVMVDYAHTPAGLEVVLARGAWAGRRRRDGSWCVFGCGGNRDRAKRPKMGRAASTPERRGRAHVGQPPRRGSAGHHRRGAGRGRRPTRAAGAFMVEPDRRAAIRRALEEARAGDVVVIAGKGHETYQEIGGRRLPFDDVRRGPPSAVGPLPVRPGHLGRRRRRPSTTPKASSRARALGSREASRCG